MSSLRTPMPMADEPFVARDGSVCPPRQRRVRDSCSARQAAVSEAPPIPPGSDWRQCREPSSKSRPPHSSLEDRSARPRRLVSPTRFPTFGGEAERPVHVWVWLDGDDLCSRSHIAEVGPDARPDLDDGVVQVGVNRLFMPSEMPIDVPVHETEEGCVEGSAPRMDFELRNSRVHGETVPQIPTDAHPSSDVEPRPFWPAMQQEIGKPDLLRKGEEGADGNVNLIWPHCDHRIWPHP